MRLFSDTTIESKLTIEELNVVNNDCKKIVMNSSRFSMERKIEMINLLQQLYPVQKQIIEDGELINMSVYLYLMQLDGAEIVPYFLKNN